MRKVPMWLLSAALLAASFIPTASAAEKFIIVASTTSTKNSGLFDHILPLFEKKTGIQVRVVAVGTGQAIRLAQNGDADVLFVHHRPSEEKFVAEGFGVKRFDVMYNDFVVVGPAGRYAAEGVGDARLDSSSATMHRTRGQRSGRFDIGRIVPQHQGLQRCVGAYAP